MVVAVAVATVTTVVVAVGPDGGTALSFPSGVTALADGTLVVADTGAHRLLRVDPDGDVTTIAGTGSLDHGGDGGPATSAHLFLPTGVAVGPGGAVFVADSLNFRVRRIDPDGTIHSIVGG